MPNLYELLHANAAKWGDSHYGSDYPAISEILEFAKDLDTGTTRYLRAAQFRALQVYWYLRLIEHTPQTFSLYRTLFTSKRERLEALGINIDNPEINKILIDEDEDALLNKILGDDAFAKTHKCQALRESMTLAYPSYILALAMGAGKTTLIGAIIATEFAMAMEYPESADSQKFVRNALVFAPGKTILGALRELADTPFEKILPPRLYKPFSANYKLTFTQDGEKTLPVIQGSSYNIIVTNTEKIRIQKSTGNRRGAASLAKLFDTKEKEDTETANLRLQALASLPNLGIFSDEAHHLNGQDLDKDLKKVRKTVDYLHENTEVIAVVNTTGTPYFGRQMLKDVVTWYGLSEGIRDNVLKDVHQNIKSYSFDGTMTADFLDTVLGDFFAQYRDVRLPNGAAAKVAIYFPQEDDLTELRPNIEKKLDELGVPLTSVLKNTSKSTTAEIADFDRLNDPRSQHRVILLVNKGTEGWNCPSLFATVLARELKRSNNFVLQAATRCLRQVSGNNTKASIYLSEANQRILSNQLQSTYHETLDQLKGASSDSLKVTIRLTRTNIPPLVIRRTVRRIVESKTASRLRKELKFVMPSLDKDREKITVTTYAAGASASDSHVLRAIETDTLEVERPTLDIRSLATALASNFRLDNREVYKKLSAMYADEVEVPVSHHAALANQITDGLKIYEVEEVEVEDSLALVRPEGFDLKPLEDGFAYTAEISVPKNKEHLLSVMKDVTGDNAAGFGFHYDPYNFDSKPEKNFFTDMLFRLNAKPEDVEDIYFTGGLATAAKTDFYMEYRGTDQRWHNYFPDFVVRLKNGKYLIVEIKATNEQNDPINGKDGKKAMALRALQGLNPDQLKYEIIFADDSIPTNNIDDCVNQLSKMSNN